MGKFFDSTKQNLGALNSNSVYVKWKEKSTARDRNRIATAVNAKDKGFRLDLEPGAAAYFDFLWKEADNYERFGGVRPIWEMEELE